MVWLAPESDDTPDPAGATSARRDAGKKVGLSFPPGGT
ncbi:hypothetical protein BN2537_17299 [Streptomyces venezuelae]|nr:hypothetical protein BN2537_17299 [Streptomyces venezuelae]